MCCTGRGGTLGPATGWAHSEGTPEPVARSFSLGWGAEPGYPLHPNKDYPYPPARLCHSPAAEPTNYLLIKSCCSWGSTEPAPPHLGAWGELVQLCPAGEFFAPGVSRRFRREESPWHRGWLWAAARLQEPPGCGQGRANLGRDNPCGTLGRSPGHWGSSLGGQRTSPALLAGAEHNCPGELTAAVASAGPPLTGPGTTRSGGKCFCPVGLEWVLRVWG